MNDLHEASKAFDDRMPELLCGFERQTDEPPIAYPVACMPQAWAAGSAFMMLQAALGLSIDADRREVRFNRPRLPAGVEFIRIKQLAVAGSEVDIEIRRAGEFVAVTLCGDGERRVSVVLAD